MECEWALYLVLQGQAIHIDQPLYLKRHFGKIRETISWGGRINLMPLDPVYPIVYLDCLVVKIRQDKRVINKANHLALGVNLEGHKELLGLWLTESEGAKFWLGVLTELQNRGVRDILIACGDGLKGLPDAISTAFTGTIPDNSLIILR